MTAVVSAVAIVFQWPSWCCSGLPLCCSGLPLCCSGLPLCCSGLPFSLFQLPLCFSGHHCVSVVCHYGVSVGCHCGSVTIHSDRCVSLTILCFTDHHYVFVNVQ